MRTIVHDGAWIAVAILAMATGCKFGNPMDRSVRVTQQPTTDELDSPSPRTRFAAGSSSGDTEADVATTKSPTRSLATRSPHESSDTDRSIANKTSVARKAPNPQTTKSSRATAESTLATSSLSKPVPATQMDNLSAEHAELLNAFRDSPPEVQQQALRQLLAVTGRSAATTSSPEGITAALKSSIGNLPALPDDSPESTALPTRLASQKTAESDDNEVVTASMNDTQSTSESNQVQQASGAAPSQVASKKTNPPPPSLTASPKPTKTKSAEPAPTPAKTLDTVSEEELYAELTRRLETGVAGESDADRYRRQIISRHLMLFSGNPDGAVAEVDGMTGSEQEFLRHYLLGVWAMVDQSGHPVAARRWTAAIPEMQMATQQLAASAELLDVRSLAFCKEIQSFGQVTKFDSSKFEAGQKVILYCEVDNFVAKSTAEGYETHLQGSYEIFDSNDRKVAGQVLPADKQICANYLRDYFIAYQMSLPTGLEPGDYRLELSMECLKGQKYGQSSIPLQITRSASK